MERVLEQFRARSREPYKGLPDWKKAHQKKIIGCLPMYIPEEFIQAAGMLPVTLVNEDVPIAAANEYIQTNTCSVVRGTLDLAVRGRLDFLDGLVFSDTCDPVQYLFGIWKVARPTAYFHVLDIPHKFNPTGGEYLLTVWGKFRRSLEDFAGKPITDQALKDAIRLYNQNRQLLRKLYDRRRANPGLIKTSDMAAVVGAGLLLPKEEHNALLTELLAKTEGKKADRPGVRLMLGGYLCDPPPESVLNLLEELGGVVVEDDMFVGGRYIGPEVKESGDPVPALAEAYFSRIPCTTMHYPEHFPQIPAGARPDYPQYLMDTLKKSGARGVVLLEVMYCDPYAFKYPTVAERLTAAGVPFIRVELDHEVGSLGPLRTRLQAFLEMLQSR